MSLASLYRREIFQSFKKNHYDLVIIGGGITGAGIALDAVSRGMKVALLEKRDFAFGASSRSTKMIHGGLRYLQKFQLKNVTRTGKERAMVYENAPHVIHRERMILPIHKGGSLGRFTTSIGLKFYDYLADVKSDERRKMLSVKETLAKVPALKKEGLRGAGEYVEYRADDARMTLEMIKKAVELGADCLNYSEVIGFNQDNQGFVEAAVIRDSATNNMHIVEGTVILNAAGGWRFEVSDLAQETDGHSLMLIKGAHLVFDQAQFPLQDALYFDTGEDKKMVFAVPRDGKTYVGVSSAVYEGDPIYPTVSITDQHYLISAINEMFPKLNITAEMIESSWAGISPVVKDKSSSKAKKPLLETAKNGLISVTTGKLTGYRELAQAVVDEIASHLKTKKNQEFAQCQTMMLPFSGGDVGGSEAFESFIEASIERGVAANLAPEEARELARIYGSNVDLLFEIAAKASPDEMLGLPLMVYVRLMYGLLYESVMTPSDFFVRRTSALYFNIQWVKAHQVAVVRFMARYFSWTVDQVKQYNTALEQALYHATHAVEDERVVKLTQKTEALIEAPSKNNEVL
ncbi:glycerol-3-phosphate dehydrogenase/oxidase [Ignatzschineria rhizosphaerae]|uniref:Glycerol-3-phosphate dehydrogenase n=1 Tax=Ignatzschineria rhizosphaerae TaxID=2923279 RepID=A0ABY3X3Q0_9GAMM|nr:glycerol-3-phosphate dehydrogenase/oxidase [Ignatzschineria rhizosphaerae]UNM97509.1 glycerol-3-phosphate dehydrogenase/oxidase [Ignatzschineria rhizosphaerae]